MPKRGRPSVYGLYAPCGELLYVGKANDPAKRLKSHMRDARRRNTPLYAWIKKHGMPEMRVLSENCKDWMSEERRLIFEARERGEARLNVADGGDEPHCPKEVRSANGVKQCRAMLTGVKSDGTSWTDDEIVADAYRYALKTYINIGKFYKARATVERLRAKHYNKPLAMKVADQYECGLAA